MSKAVISILLFVLVCCYFIGHLLAPASPGCAQFFAVGAGSGILALVVFFVTAFILGRIINRDIFEK